MTKAAATLRIEGLEDLRRRSGLAPRAFDRVSRIVVRRAGYRVRRESRDIVPGTVFDRSILMRSATGGLTALVGSTASERTVRSIQEGRKPGEAPSLKATSRWLRTRGLAGTVSVSTRRRRAVRQDAVAALARTVQAEIRSRGTRPIQFLTRALPPSLPDIHRYFREEIGKALAKVARG